MFEIGTAVMVGPSGSSYSVTKPGSWGIITAINSTHAKVLFKYTVKRGQHNVYIIKLDHLVPYTSMSHPFNRVVGGV